MCGYQRKSVLRNPTSKIAVDLAAIDARLQQLTQTAQKSSYSKRKSSLRVEFETFLACLPNARSIFSATPEVVSRFLVWKDRHGKTVVHVPIVQMSLIRMCLFAGVPNDSRLTLLILI